MVSSPLTLILDSKWLGSLFHNLAFSLTLANIPLSSNLSSRSFIRSFISTNSMSSSPSARNQVAIFEKMLKVDETKCSFQRRFRSQDDSSFPCKRQSSPRMSRDLKSPSDFKFRLMEMLYFEEHVPQDGIWSGETRRDTIPTGRHTTRHFHVFQIGTCQQTLLCKLWTLPYHTTIFALWATSKNRRIDIEVEELILRVFYITKQNESNFRNDAPLSLSLSLSLLGSLLSSRSSTFRYWSW